MVFFSDCCRKNPQLDIIPDNHNTSIAHLQQHSRWHLHQEEVAAAEIVEDVEVLEAVVVVTVAVVEVLEPEVSCDNSQSSFCKHEPASRMGVCTGCQIVPRITR